MQRRVADHVSVVAAEGRFIAQHLFEECAEKFRVCAHLLLDVRTARQHMRGGPDQRRGRLATGAEQRDHHRQRCDLAQFARGTGLGEVTQQIVLRIGGGPLEVVVDVAREFHHGNACRGEVILVDKAFDHLGARVAPPHQLVDVDVGHTDQASDDHHRQSIGHRRHPLDAAVLHAFVPQPVCGLADERLERVDPSGRQLRHQQLPVRGMGRVIGGRQRLNVSTEFTHDERADLAVLVGHGGGQIRREVLGTGDDVVDGIPTAHGVES